MANETTPPSQPAPAGRPVRAGRDAAVERVARSKARWAVRLLRRPLRTLILVAALAVLVGLLAGELFAG